ncbi:MAG: hypothetical protein J6A07_09850 [Firmicutes bacterium]|nr:hypothetical protein [Bacillota bacterium]
MKQTVILGNIITMDEKRPFAKAALVKNGVFAYIGEADEVKKLAASDAKVFDCDFLHDDIEKVAKAKVIATIVDGEEVYIVNDI